MSKQNCFSWVRFHEIIFALFAKSSENDILTFCNTEGYTLYIIFPLVYSIYNFKRLEGSERGKVRNREETRTLFFKLALLFDLKTRLVFKFDIYLSCQVSFTQYLKHSGWFEEAASALPVNFVKFVRTLSLQNTSRRLPLDFVSF